MKKKILKKNWQPHTNYKGLENYGDNQSSKDIDHFESYFNSLKNNFDKIDVVRNFPLFVRRQDLIYYLSKYELFKKTLDVKGSIIECGSHTGASLLLFAKLTSIFQPYDIHKKVISFDTFSGFPDFNKNKDNVKYKRLNKTQFNNTSLNLIKEQINLFDKNRFNNHIEKVEIVKGDAVKTIPAYIKKNKHLIVSLLYLDFDLYDPTCKAIENFLPRMPKGALVVFDQINQKRWYGETLAMLKKFNINQKEIKVLPCEPNISYFIV
tara:strand:- start:1010 stop:1804 length:795 start_codon:yes stop_codon:yes gene_type:complete